MPFRRMVASSKHLAPEDRLDALVHALAQAPARTTLDLWGDGPDRARLQAVARAYGLHDRVRFADAAPAVGAGAIVVYPSAHNLGTAMLRPGDEPGLVLGADPPEGSGLERTTFAGLVEALHGPGDRQPLPTGDDSVLRGARVAVITNIPTHYRVPLFEGLSDRLASAGAHLRVLFLARSYRRRAWMRPGDLRFDHGFLRSVGVRLSSSRQLFVPVDLTRALRAYSPTLIVAGSLSPLVAGRAARFGRRRGIPVGIWSGATSRSSEAEPGFGRRRRVRLLSRASFGAAYGIEADHYLANLRPGLPVVIVRNATPIPAAGPGRTASDALEVLTIGDMSRPSKNLVVLVQAMAGRPSLSCRLTVAGGGRGLDALRAQAAPLGDRVRLLGPVPSDRIHAEYARADAFAFPSQMDPFGLVLPEAMGAGIATATSDRPGAAADLAVDGHNALVVTESTPAAWAEALQRLAEDPRERTRLGAAGAETVARRWTLEHSVDAWVAALRLGASTRG